MTKVPNLSFLFYVIAITSNAQSIHSEKPATLVIFRTFNLLDFKFSYKLYADDSLITRVKTHDVIILETNNPAITLHASTKAPSFNATKKTNYKRIKTIRYPIKVEPGKVYLVKAGFHNIELFHYPRQPSLRLIKPSETVKYLKKRFLQKKVKRYLFERWKMEGEV